MEFMKDRSYVEGFAYNLIDDFENAKVESGEYFGATKVFTISAPIGTSEVYLEMGNKFCHGVFTFNTNTLCMVEFFFNPALTNSGTPILINNFKTYANNTSATKLYHLPSVTTDGTKILEGITFGSGGKNAIGASDTSLRRSILAPFTKYLIRFTSLPVANSQPVNDLYYGIFKFNYYETSIA